MSELNQQAIAGAIEDFRRARRRAAMQEILARVTGESTDLLSFDDVRAKLKVGGGIERGLREIPLDAIVGSVGRYKDFTRNFLPRHEVSEHRWAQVKSAATDLTGLSPIEVYQLGEAYFVLDGNHRVSVARELGETTIQAYVTEYKSKVPLSPNDEPDDLILKAELTDFLEQTKIDVLRPESDLRLTEPGRYWQLKTQIDALHFMMGQEQGRDVPYAEAVTRWYDEVYLPLVQVIRERGILRDFPDRTETDLYLWIFYHRAELEKRLGWQIDPDTAVTDLVVERRDNSTQIVSRLEQKIVDAIAPDSLESGPAAGQWRRERVEPRQPEHLFTNILVPFSGAEETWSALDQALLVAEREQSQLYGLRVVASEGESQTEAMQAVKRGFEERCQAAGRPGTLSFGTGTIAREVVERARLVDLVVIHLAHPPGTGLVDRFYSGFRTILHRCPRPVLTVPGPVSAMDNALLAYDGSPKAQEGLFVATYLAGKWQIPLTVLTVDRTGTGSQILDRARQYLEQHNIEATFVIKTGSIVQTILDTVIEDENNLLIMGGYGQSSVVEVVLGSVVDQVLREVKLPLLICR